VVFFGRAEPLFRPNFPEESVGPFLGKRSKALFCADKASPSDGSHPAGSVTRGIASLLLLFPQAAREKTVAFFLKVPLLPPFRQTGVPVPCVF